MTKDRDRLELLRKVLLRHATAAISDFTIDHGESGEARLGGVVTNYRKRPRRSGAGFVGFFLLEDGPNQLEVIVLPKAFERLETVITSGQPLLCVGSIADLGEGAGHEWKMILDDAVALSYLAATEDVSD